MAGSYSARSALMAPLHWPTLPLPGTMILSVMKIGHLCDSKTLKTCYARPKSYARSITSLFKRGLRRIHTCIHRLIPIPPLWAEWLIPQTDPW